LSSPYSHDEEKMSEKNTLKMIGMYSSERDVKLAREAGRDVRRFESRKLEEHKKG